MKDPMRQISMSARATALAVVLGCAASSTQSLDAQVP